jgi:hypothetical protein
MASFVLFTGCVAEGSNRGRSYHSGPAVQVQAGVTFEDDYDYYPGYETYYSRSRREFVYRDGNSWVRRPQPRGISVGVLLATPAVRMTFRDAPERHHSTVARTYPKNWTPSRQGHEDNRKDVKRNERSRDERRN